MSYFFYLLINPPAACLLALGLSLAITPEQSYKVISQTAQTKPAVDNKICEPEKCLISAKQNLQGHLYVAETAWLETQPGRMKKEITLTKPSVGNKIRNTEKLQALPVLLYRQCLYLLTVEDYQTAYYLSLIHI